MIFRRIMKVLLLLCLLAVIVVVAAAAVLLSDAPHSIMESTLSNQLELDANITSLKIGWQGTSIVRGISMRLAVENEDIVKIKHLHIEHSSLWEIITSMDFRIYAINIPSGDVYIRKISDDKWNYEYAMENLPGGGQRGENEVFSQLRGLFVQEFTVHMKDKELRVSANLDISGDEAAGKGVATLDFTQFGHKESKVRVNAKVDGSMSPLNISMDGDVLIEKFAHGHKELFPMKADFSGELNENEIVFRTGEVELFETPFEISGVYLYENDEVNIAAEFSQMDIALAKNYLDFKADISGIFKGHIDITMNMSSPADAAVSGRLSAEDFNIYGFDADDARASFALHERMVVADDILLSSGDGSLKGALSFDIEAPDLLDITFEAQRYPLSIADGETAIEASGEGRMQFNAAQRHIKGQAQLDGRIELMDKPAGEMNCKIEIEENMLQMRQFSGNFLNGTVSGEADIFLPSPFESRLNARWEDVDLDELKRWFPPLTYELGLTSGSIETRASERKSLEPSISQIEADFEGDFFDIIGFKDAALTLEAGRNRLLITDSKLNILDGEIAFQARASYHDDKMRFYANSDVKNIDANMILMAFLPDSDRIEGTINGSGFIVTSADFSDASGAAQLKMQDLNLINNTIVNSLYNTLNPGFISPRSRGKGRLGVRLETARVIVEEFYYYHKGMEIYGDGSIADLRKGTDSEIEGVVIGTVRPLKDITLPGLKTLDKALFVLQREMAAVKVSGTVGQTSVDVVSLPEVRSAVKNIISTFSD